MEMTRLGLKAGRYEGRLSGAEMANPVVELVHLERVVALADVEPMEDGHKVVADVPSLVLSDGVQIVTLRAAVDGTVLDRLVFLCGAELDGDFRAEMALMREELELLKRAFRRHCAES